jgi:uncharacterized protein (DUF1330 family)
MIRHVVVWKIAATDPEQKASDTQTVVDLLSSLPPIVPSIVSLSVGGNVIYPETNWDVSVVIDFESLDDLEAYQADPEHLKVSAQVKQLVGERSGVDFVV